MQWGCTSWLLMWWLRWWPSFKAKGATRIHCGFLHDLFAATQVMTHPHVCKHISKPSCLFPWQDIGIDGEGMKMWLSIIWTVICFQKPNLAIWLTTAIYLLLCTYGWLGQSYDKWASGTASKASILGSIDGPCWLSSTTTGNCRWVWEGEQR